LESMTACVAPFAPHTSDELWQQLGHSVSIHHDSWPKYDEQYLVSDTITIAVQVNGKVRATIEVTTEATEETIVDSAKADPKVQAHLQQKEVRKTIYVPQKLVNFVV
jgi:leucyl-tRNA synthetase